MNTQRTLDSLDIRKILDFFPELGEVRLAEDRMLIFRQDAFQKFWLLLNEQLGSELARNIISRFGHQCGYGDFQTLRNVFSGTSEAESLGLGPKMHTLEGLVLVEPIEHSFDKSKKRFYFRGRWRNSFEADIYLKNSKGVFATAPVCHSLTGYASGWCSAFSGFPCIAVETKCVGMGHDCCEWEIKNLDACDDYARPWIHSLFSESRSIYKQLEDQIKKYEELNISLEQSKIEAEKSNQAKSDFLAKMSHEIRTPLNVFLGTQQLLESKLETHTDTEVQQYMDMLRTSVNNLLSLVNNVLDLSKIEQGKLEAIMRTFEVRRLLADINSIFFLKAQVRHNNLRFVVDDDVPDFVIGDPMILRQVLVNLIDNALKFSEQNEVLIKVSANKSTEHKGNLLFSIEDRGIGLSPEDIQRIFQSYTQAQNHDKIRYGGTGLGLSICKEFVYILGGTLWVESEKGKYSKFSFTAYMPPSAPSEKPRAETPISDTLNYRGKKILFVDDSEENLFLFVRFFKELDVKVITCTSGQEAIELYKKEVPDLIFMDIRMEGMDGLDTTREIRKVEKLCHLVTCPIVAVSANAFNTDVKASLEAGCNLHLSKPIKKNDLISTAISLLSNYRDSA